MIIFFIEKVNRSLKYHIINEHWAQDFINLASSHPYYAKLEPYMNFDHNELKTQLQLVTGTIILMELPESLFGVTFSNLTMCLRLFPDSRGCKGATFSVFLHELTHYLQRAAGTTIKQCDSLKSSKNIQVREDWYNFVREFFGDRLYLITEEAAEFLVTPPLPDTYEAFLEKFKKKNERSDHASIINLIRSGGPIYLGGCGSKFSINCKD